ncbi:metalloendoproteinase 5-MMP-like [Chenopodium quinoa]|uniref:metalloendoproteinase 5-MMP-like n=1 Tax=Chenopodium quinoa TaxID=63459 RepID=UPI000B7949FC|nr:metalloendoproteinase 5-MMP-like [Chenopodium quinoa]
MAIKEYLLSVILLLLLTLVPFTTQSKQNANPFGFLKSLEGCKKGQNVDGLHQLKMYLTKLGYLNNHHVSQNEVTTSLTIKEDNKLFDESLEKAIKTYQRNYRLNITGHLDGATVKQMMKPRCGCADIVNGRNTMQHKHNKTSLYVLKGRKWPSSEYELTFQILSKTLVPGAGNMTVVVTAALNKWAQVSPFQFQEVPEDSKSNLVFGFFNGDHGDGRPFDGPLGVLGHSFYPEDGRSHYDATEDWSEDPGPNQFDLNSVVLHEIGHLLGLAHSADPSAVMHPGIAPGGRRRELQPDDIQGIQALYGPN